MTAYEETAAFFDGTADVYDDWFLRDVHYRELLGALVYRLQTYDPSHVLELGCGTGNLSFLLANTFPQASIKAVDISQELLGQAATKCAAMPNLTLTLQDMLSAVEDLPDGGCVIANYSLHHLVDAEKVLLCQRLGEGLKPGNAALIGDVFYPPPPQSDERGRAGAVLDLFHARASYYLSQVGLDRCVFEVEHLPLVLERRREHLVEQSYWSQLAPEHGLRASTDEAVGPKELGNFLVELVPDGI
ncbi:MAG TPA: class I SAM-dependent methyltransferase [Solirubrobacterales bacterium]